MMPKTGMAYEDVARRVKRIEGSTRGHPAAKRNLVNSLKNQCRLAEGNSAITELERECAITKGSLAFSGAGHRQIGWGPGHKLGDGKWRYIDGNWIQDS